MGCPLVKHEYACRHNIYYKYSVLKVRSIFYRKIIVQLKEKITKKAKLMFGIKKRTPYHFVKLLVSLEIILLQDLCDLVLVEKNQHDLALESK